MAARLLLALVGWLRNGFYRVDYNGHRRFKIVDV